MAGKQYDMIIIGAGSASLSASLFMNKAGFNVLLIDKTDQHIGGDCLNDGCIPSKALLHTARVIHRTKEAEAFGFKLSGGIDITKATAYIYDKQSIIRAHENADYFRKEGLKVVLGEAKFTGPNEVQIKGTRYSGKKIVIATGSRPRKLYVPGIEQVRYYDNQSIFYLDRLPKRLLVIGDGPIGTELGQAMSRLGSTVTVVHRGNAILEQDDPAISQVLQEQMKKEGIEFLLEATMESFPTPHEAILKLKDDSIRTLPIDAILVAVGRERITEGLDLEKGGIEVKDGKIIVNDYLQTNKNVFVCGDVAGSLQFSHAAEQQARMLLINFFSPIKKKLNNDHMSWVKLYRSGSCRLWFTRKTITEKRNNLSKAGNLI